MPDSAYIYEIEDVVAAVNRKTGWKVQLHAFWNYPIWRDSCAGFKLHDKFRDPLRVMHLSVPARNLPTGNSLPLPSTGFRARSNRSSARWTTTEWRRAITQQKRVRESRYSSHLSYSSQGGSR